MATRSKVLIELEVEGDSALIAEIVDRVLDAGSLQDAINLHDDDDELGPRAVSVLSCTFSMQAGA